MTLQATPDAAFIAEMVAYLAEQGYRVTKARATRATSTAGRPDGCAPATVRSAKHTSCAAHWRVPGLDKPVCMTPEGATFDDTGEPVGPEWTDTESVLAFAVDVGARGRRYERSAIGYVGADQSGAVLPNSWTGSSYREPIAHNLHAAIDGKGATPYGRRIGCEECAELDAAAERAAVLAAQHERMQATPHAFTSAADYMATCTECGADRSHDAHTWPEHTYADKYGSCATCRRRPAEGHGLIAAA